MYVAMIVVTIQLNKVRNDNPEIIEELPNPNYLGNSIA